MTFLRVQNLLNPRQPACAHRRVLGLVVCSISVVWTSIFMWTSLRKPLGHCRNRNFEPIRNKVGGDFQNQPAPLHFCFFSHKLTNNLLIFLSLNSCFWKVFRSFALKVDLLIFLVEKLKKQLIYRLYELNSGRFQTQTSPRKPDKLPHIFPPENVKTYTILTFVRLEVVKLKRQPENPINLFTFFRPKARKLTQFLLLFV